jgi:putative endonuclease
MTETKRQWWVYIVVAESGSLYTGISTDVDRRFDEHCQIKLGKGAKFFRSDKAVAVVYKEPLADRSEASKRESVIKKMSRRQKCQLVKMPYKPVERGWRNKSVN